MKYVRGKSLFLDDIEYSQLKRVDGGYMLDLEKVNLENHNEEIRDFILAGKSRPFICDIYKVTSTEFDNYLYKQFGSKKITDAKMYLVKNTPNHV
jgi:hypothetical protein